MLWCGLAPAGFCFCTVHFALIRNGYETREKKSVWRVDKRKSSREVSGCSWVRPGDCVHHDFPLRSGCLRTCHERKGRCSCVDGQSDGKLQRSPKRNRCLNDPVGQ